MFYYLFFISRVEAVSPEVTPENAVLFYVSGLTCEALSNSPRPALGRRSDQTEISILELQTATTFPDLMPMYFFFISILRVLNDYSYM